MGVRPASMKSGVVFNPDDTLSVTVKLKPGRVRVEMPRSRVTPCCEIVMARKLA